MLGIPRFPGTDTIRNLFSRFTRGAIEAFWRPLWPWLLPDFAAPHEGFSLDLHSTIFQRSGRQQGAAKDYNLQRSGRKRHHPLLAILGEAQCVLHAWLRAGNTSASRLAGRDPMKSRRMTCSAAWHFIHPVQPS